MVKYTDDFKTAEYNGYKFTRDNVTGYYLSAKPIDGKRRRLHVYVYETETGEKVPDGYQIHHKDEDKRNNEISNLVCMTEHDHLSYHSKKNLAENAEHKEKFIERGIEAAKEWHKSDEGRKWHREHWQKIRGALYDEREYKCAFCGKTFKSKKVGSRFCNNAHKSAYRRKMGYDNVLRKCVVCGKMFVVNKYLKTKTCTRECAARLRGMNNEQKQKEKDRCE